MLTSVEIARIRATLLAYYDESGRALPWRATRDPYAILVSEVMAQQTRVEAVIPYYTRWLNRFPDFTTLAEAPVDDVLKHWEGLGYYARARNLHATARVVRERHNGALPATYDELRALPGIGDYTAGAVSSIVFGAAEPAVDGNVRRVLSRVLDEPDPSATRLRSVAAALVSPERPGDFNQALMELGARVCTPRSPRCDSCPLHHDCRARAHGTQLERPRRAQKKVLPQYDVATLVVRHETGDTLLVRRPSRGLLAGMWTFPGQVTENGNTADAIAGLFATSFGDALRATPRELGIIEHTFSHRRERYLCYEVHTTLRDVAADHVWVSSDASGVTLPRAQRRIHEMAFPSTIASNNPRGGLPLVVPPS